MSLTTLKKGIIDQISGQPCNNNDCLSQRQQALSIVFFGKQYQQKHITCTSCYVSNDEKLAKSIPTSKNVLSLNQFVNIFVQELKVYEQKKASIKWPPKLTANYRTEILNQLSNTEANVNESLRFLLVALKKLFERIAEQMKKIHHHREFEDLIELGQQQKSGKILQQIGKVIVKLNQVGQVYKFQNIQEKNKQIKAILTKIEEITGKTIKAVNQLYESLKEKNKLISKF